MLEIDVELQRQLDIIHSAEAVIRDKVDRHLRTIHSAQDAVLALRISEWFIDRGILRRFHVDDVLYESLPDDAQTAISRWPALYTLHLSDSSPPQGTTPSDCHHA